MNEWRRMCDYYLSSKGNCDLCGLYAEPFNDCGNFVKTAPDDAIQIIQEWSEEHQLQEHQLQIDWLKVPADTPVLVRDTDLYEWKKRYFISCIKDVFVVSCGGHKREDAHDVCIYKQCKLAPEVDPTPFLKDGE
jgi:hypothetical protein